MWAIVIHTKEMIVQELISMPIVKPNSFFPSFSPFLLETRIFCEVFFRKKECTSDENAQPAGEYRNACSNSSESVQQAAEVGGPPSSSYFSFAPWKRSFDCVNGIRNKSWRRGYVRSTYVVIMSSTTGGIFSNCRQMDTELLEGRRGTLRLQIVFPGESFWESLSCSCLE